MNSSSHRAITRYLTDLKVEYHTFFRPKDRDINVVVRGVDNCISIEALTEDLASLGFHPKEIRRLTKKSGAPMPLVKIRLPREEHSIYNIKFICGLSIKVEQQNYSHARAQCRNCLQFDHSAANCFAAARCLKCARDHRSKDCTKDPALPAKCYNCGGAHTATYSGCPVHPSNSKKPTVAPSAPQVRSRPLSRPVTPDVSFAATIGGRNRTQHFTSLSTSPQTHRNAPTATQASAVNNVTSSFLGLDIQTLFNNFMLTHYANQLPLSNNFRPSV